MGFEAPETIYRLKFADPGMDGLEVMAREPSIEQLLEMTGMSTADAASADPDKLRAVFRMFAGLLESWNVTRKAEPVPATYEGVISLNSGFVMKIIGALSEAVGRPDPTLPPASSGGGTAPDPMEISIPMTPASPGSS